MRNATARCFADSHGLRPAYRVAQVCDADALDHRWVTEAGRRAGEMVEEAHSGAKKNRRDVDGDLVEEAGVEALLDGVSPVDADGLTGGRGLGLVNGALEAVGHEVDGRIGSRPAVRDVMGQDECRSPRVVSTPATGDLESASTGEHGTESGGETADGSALGPDKP